MAEENKVQIGVEAEVSAAETLNAALTKYNELLRQIAASAAQGTRAGQQLASSYSGQLYELNKTIPALQAKANAEKEATQATVEHARVMAGTAEQALNMAKAAAAATGRAPPQPYATGLSKDPAQRAEEAQRLKIGLKDHLNDLKVKENAEKQTSRNIAQDNIAAIKSVQIAQQEADRVSATILNNAIQRNAALVNAQKQQAKEGEEAEKRKVRAHAETRDEIIKEIAAEKRAAEEVARAREAQNLKIRVADRARIEEHKKQLQEEAEAAKRAAEAPTAITGALGGISITERTLGKLDVGQANAARLAINNLAQAMAAGRVTAEDLSKAVENINSKGFTALTGGAATAAAQLRNIQSVAESSAHAISISWGGAFRLFQVFVARRILFALAQELRAAVDEAVKFEIEMTKISIVMTNAGESVEGLRDKIREVTSQFSLPGLDLANASYQLFASRVGTASERLKLLEESGRLATVTFSTAEQAAKSLSDTIQGFNLEAADGTRVAQSLFAAVTEGRTDLKTVDSLIGATSLSARQLGISLNEVIAMFLSLRQQGVPAQQAIRSIESTFQAITREGGPLNEVFFNLYGVTAKAFVQSEGLGKALQVISEQATKGSGKTRELASAFLKTDENVVKLTKNLEGLPDVMKKYDDATAKVLDSTGKRWESFTQRIKTGVSGIGTFIANAGAGIDRLIEGSETIIVEHILGIDRSLDRSLANMRRNIQNFHATQRQEQEESNKRIEQSFIRTYNTLEQAIGQRLIKIHNVYTNHTDLIKQDFKSLDDVIKHIVDSANRDVKRIQQILQSGHERQEQDTFRRITKGLPAAQEYRLVEDRIRQLAARREGLVASGDIQGAEQLSREIQQLYDRLYTIVEQYWAKRRKLNETNRRLDNAQLKELNRQSIQQQLQHDKQQENLRHLRARGAPGEAERHARNIAAIQAAAEDYRGQLRLVDIQLQRAEAERKIFQSKGASQQRTEALIAIEQRITQLKYEQLLIAQQAAKAELGETAKKAKETFDKNSPILQGQINTALANQKDRQKELEEFEEKRPDRLEAAVKAARDLEKAFKAIPVLLSDEDKQRAVEKLKELAKDAKEKIEDAVKAGLTDPGTFAAAQKAIEVLRKAAAEVFKGGLEDIDVSKPKEALKRLKEFAEEKKTEEELTKQRDAFIKQRQNAEKELERITEDMNRALNNVAVTSKDLAGNTAYFNEQLKNLITAIEDATKRLNVLKAEVVERKPEGKKQFGGLIDFGPPGIDQVLAQLTRGEFVMNPEATRMFYPQLKAMNALQVPAYEKGGLVGHNTNVGDIHISVQGGSTAESTVREIGYRLERELRRGTIRFPS